MNKKIFGVHDDNTLDQFEKCLVTGSAHIGVLFSVRMGKPMTGETRGSVQ